MRAHAVLFVLSSTYGLVGCADGAPDEAVAAQDESVVGIPLPSPGSSPSAAGGALQVATGTYHSCALTVSHGVRCWGANENGQVGDGTAVDRAVATQVTGLTANVLAVVAGDMHSCALLSNGTVKCWGANGGGQLGDGTFTSRTAPMTVVGVTGARAIASGPWHTCAVVATGVKCWGANGGGQLGDGTTTTQPVAVSVRGLGGTQRDVAAGGYHTCAVSTTGAVACWGGNNYGQLGDGTTSNRLTPTVVSGLASGAKHVATGFLHTCAVNAAGATLCWGYADDGEIGDGTAPQSVCSSTGTVFHCSASAVKLVPTQVTGRASGGAQVGAGGSHSCGRSSAGAVQCWGLNDDGELGDGTTTMRLTPVAVSGLGSGVVDVATGVFHSCAVLSSGEVRCWGQNWFGALGNGTTCDGSCPLVPQTVRGLPIGI